MRSLRIIGARRPHLVAVIARAVRARIACRRGRCSYSIYLSHQRAGEVNLSHRVFHLQEARLLQLQEHWEEWADRHGGYGGYPAAGACQELERRLRA